MEVSKETFKREVEFFRTQIKSDTVVAASKSIFLEKRGNVGVLVFDQFQEKANKLSSPNMLRLSELLLQVEGDRSMTSLVILSGKPTIFIAGADINEIETLSTSGSSESLMKLQAIFTFLENLPIPKIAAIHGACLGGGLELVLACDWRIATDAPETRLGLPEVQLGIIPGWGGTQRLPRLLGLEASLDLILTGRHVDGKSAKRMGLVDKLVPKEILEEKALAWAIELAKSGKKRPPDPRAPKQRLLEAVPGGKWLVFELAKKKLLAKTKGHYPAPLRALEVIKDTHGGSLEAGLKKEAHAFTELVKTPECKNLIRIFFLTEKVKKDKGAEAAPREIQTAGVLGAGTMGGGIAQLFAAKGVRVRMKDIHWDAVTKGYQAAHKIFYKQVERRKMKQSELQNLMARIEGTVSFSGFQHLDLVVEAVVEDIDIKRKVFEELDRIAPHAILATNTSSLSVSEMALVCKDPSRVVGMHFFNPVDKMPLVEVIRAKQSSEEAVATIVTFAKRLGKTPIVVGDSPGFLVNRVLGPYLNEAVYLLSEGMTPIEIDELMEKFGMPMGPCALLDEIGLDVAFKVCKVLYGAFGERMKPPSLMDGISTKHRLGKKSGKGIYLYEGKKRVEDPTLLNKLGVKGRQSHLSDEVAEKRLIYVMVNEAARCLGDNLVREVSDIDVGMIFGTGFAPFRGGLLRYADSVGPEAITGDLEVFVRNYGTRFQPCEYLQKLAVAKKMFYESITNQ